MKKNKLLSMLLVLILVIGCLCGCGGGSAETGEEGGQTGSEAAISVTDQKGRVIELSEPAKRVVALTASDCEIIYALGAEETLVGRGEYCTYPAEVTEVTMVASGSETNLEQIIALAPQVVLMNEMDQTEEQVNALEKAGIKVVVNDANNIEETYDSIEIIGTIVGKDAEAKAMVDSMKSAFAGMEAHKDIFAGKTVYFEVSPLEYGLWTAGPGSFMDEIATMMGLTNIFGDVDPWAQVSEEQVLQRNPDYIVSVAMYFGEGMTPVEEILSRPGWSNVTAIKNNDILNLQNDELSRPGPRLVDGAQLLFDMISEEQ
ncbi:MAG: ABC transporter substrate-binding protein [Firmicutes bacterium]|nr:ABC transporter substrate-binding protein [Bacillota bacterium]